MVCADDAGHLGSRINSHLAGDTFEITTEGTQVCARRSDSSGVTHPGKIRAIGSTYWVIHIDDSSENTKCVTSSLPVICADDAGHLCNCVNSHLDGDTFEITTDGLEVCATRTDSGGRVDICWRRVDKGPLLGSTFVGAVFTMGPF